jgi:hypothetical protein
MRHDSASVLGQFRHPTLTVFRTVSTEYSDCFGYYRRQFKLACVRRKPFTQGKQAATSSKITELSKK